MRILLAAMIGSRTIKQLAFSAGFDLCGITSADIIPEARERYVEWLKLGYHGEMAYMAKDSVRRTDPRQVLENARSLIMLGLNYYQPNSSAVPKGFGRVSRYARGRDYHKIMERKARGLVASIIEALASEASRTFRFFVDYGPVLERAYGERAGLGYIGKNGMLINRRYGSWFFLAEILTDLELEFDDQYAVNHGRCGSCQKCIDACPTGAITGGGVIDSRRCISYLTIEKPSDIPRALAKQMRELVFGCDICQEVCPHNGRAMLTKHHQLMPHDGAGEFLGLKRVLGLKSREDFLNLTAGTPLTRPGLEGLQRIARIVIGNEDKSNT
jgi:epoxyqueuosine reductase